MRPFKKVTAAVTIVATAVLGTACATDDGGTSPGQEAPADDTGGGDDDGLY
jgi:hypothetical protein